MSRRRCPQQTPLCDTDLRPGPATAAGLSECRRLSSLDRWQRPYVSGSKSGMSSSSSVTDNTFSILSSCGLEPADLTLLAELPEDELSVESLPRLLRQIKSGREALRPPPVSSSHRPGSPVGRLRLDPGQLVQYPLDHIKSAHLPAERVCDWRGDRWQNPRMCAPVSQTLARRSEPALRSSGSYADAGPGRTAATVSSSSSSSSSSLERGHVSASQTRSRPAGPTTPSKREMRDFYDAEPQTYPTRCSLCNIHIISAENWTKHIHDSQHADGQQSLLQRFPTWDCRMDALTGAERPAEKKRDDGDALQSTHSTDDSTRSQATKSAEKKLAQRSKVACVKFPARSVEESYLRKLAEPFGAVTRILMFPSLAFVELESAEQTQELVTFHNKCPPNVKGQRLDFSISKAFHFVKSSRVVDFTPPPQSHDDRSDLLAVVKRFGAPVYTLFQHSQACVEMKNLEDAEKLVDYYSSNKLRINDQVLRVSFAVETASLGTNAFAQRYPEESSKVRTSADSDRMPDESDKSGGGDRKAKSGDGKARSHSRQRKTRSKSRERKARSKSRDRETRSKSRDRKVRSRSRGRDRKTRSKSRDRKTRSKSRDRNVRSRSRDRDRKTRSKSRDRKARSKSRDGKFRSRSRDRKTRSKSKEKSSSCSGNMSEADKTASTCASAAASQADGVDQQLSNVDVDADYVVASSTDDDSDIEGMAVLGEDLLDDDLESGDEHQQKHQVEEEDSPQPESRMLPIQCEGKEEECKVAGDNKENKDSGIKAEDESDEDVDLEDCITQDEAGREGGGRASCLSSDCADGDCSDYERHASRVVCFQELPLAYCDADVFVGLVEGLGTPVRYSLLHEQRKGFLEMSHSSEAIRVFSQLSVSLRNTRTVVLISSQHRRLLDGLPVDRDDERETAEHRRGSSSCAERSSKGKEESEGGRKPLSTSDQDKEKIAQDKKSASWSDCGNIQDVELQSRKTKIKSESDQTLDMGSEDGKTLVFMSDTRKSFEPKVEDDNTRNAQLKGGKTSHNKSDDEESLEDRSEGGNANNVQSKDAKTPHNQSQGGQRLQMESDNGTTVLQFESQGKKTLQMMPEGEKTAEMESEGRNTLEKESKAKKRRKDGSESEEMNMESKSKKTCQSQSETQEKNTESQSVFSKVSEKMSLTDSCCQETLMRRSASPEDTAGPAKRSQTSVENDNNQEADGLSSGSCTEALQPVGSEFVRPVTGYFCILCHPIYADEQAAKVQHCSSRQHHLKYQEMMKNVRERRPTFH
ncbi:uncharacterized protein LOC144026426 isoform X2 [Festucalex cinctus]